MVIDRPDAGLDRIRDVNGRPGTQGAATATADRPVVSTALAQCQSRAGAAQHRRPLRLVERALRRIPRRDNDILVRVFQPAAPPATGVLRFACSTTAQDRPAA